MKNNILTDIKVGEVVVSVKGRDNGSLYLVTKVLTDKKASILIADGRLHKTDSPKRKNVKHIKRTGLMLEDMLQKINSGKNFTQTELYNLLKSLKADIV